MANRTWTQIEDEARTKIITPLPTNRIITKLSLTYKQFKKLVNLGVLVFVYNKSQYRGGKPPKRFVAIKEAKLRISEEK